MFEHFASEYGWTHGYILDNLTPAQFKLYSELLLCRMDDEKIERQELSILQAGGDLKEFHRKRRSLRDILKGKAQSSKDEVKDQVKGTTSDMAKVWLASLGLRGGDKVGLQ